MHSLSGQVAIVTGAASGIGLALSAELARRGATVVLCDMRQDAVTRAADGLQGSVEHAVLDVTNAEGFDALVRQTMERHGRLDVLFNNAGIGLAGEVRDLSLADWRRVTEVNWMGVVHGVQAAYPVMVRQGFGHIVNTASGAALAPRPGMTPYAATKAAVVAMSLSLRAEGQALGVRVSAICPGYIATAIQSSTRFVNLDGKRLTERIPIKPISAQRCAEKVLSGVRRNKPIIVVGGTVWFDWLLFRLSPRLALRAASIRTRAFRSNRRE